MKLTLRDTPNTRGNLSCNEVCEVVPSISALQLIESEQLGYLDSYKFKDIIFHSGYPLMGPSVHKIDRIELEDCISLFSFSIGPACKEARIKDFYYVNESPILTREQLKKEIMKRIYLVRWHILGTTMIAIENTNYYPYFAYEDVTDSDFLTEIVNENNIYFCLDIAHALVTCNNKQDSFYEYIDHLPLDRCVEIHISKIGKVGGLWRDLHEAPDEYEFDLLEYILQKVENPYVVVEYGRRCQETLIEVYKELERRFL